MLLGLKVILCLMYLIVTMGEVILSSWSILMYPFIQLLFIVLFIISYMEIYNEKVRDLLKAPLITKTPPSSQGSHNLKVREHPRDGPYVESKPYNVICFISLKPYLNHIVVLNKSSLSLTHTHTHTHQILVDIKFQITKL